MSYVLEALKKAQAQREQGGVPGIHSLQVPYVAVEGKARSNLKPVLWAIAVLLVAIVALLVWRTEGGNVPPAAQSSASMPPVAAAVVPPGPVAPPPAPVVTPEPTPVAESLSKGEVQLAGPTPAERAAAKKKEKPQPKPKLPTTAQPKAEPKATAPRVYAVAELPEDVRRALPTLVISGGSYSTNPAQRLIIVNNQVFTEKSEPAPGVVVQSIEPSAAVLTYRGYSYRVAY